MNKITESAIEEFAIELLKKSGYQYVYAPNIAPDSDTPERNRFEDVLLLERLQSAVGRITQNKAKTIDTNDDQGINNKQIHTLEKLRDTLLLKLMSGEVQVECEKDGVSYHEK
jgi:type I restriction enzyme R subunit